MAAATKDLSFRDIREGDGGTLPLYRAQKKPSDPLVPLRIGTALLMSCVGVYFKVDEKRCFFAHFDARTPEMTDWTVVSPKAGENIKKQVKDRLFAFMKYDRWVITDKTFGQHLYFQCPQHNARVFNECYSPTTGWFIVRAVREFFVACSVLIKEKVEERRKEELKIKESKLSAYKKETNVLQSTAESHQSKAVKAKVERGYHAFIVTPDREFNILKMGVVQPEKVNTREELGDNVAVEENFYWPDKKTRQYHNCFFGVLQDKDMRKMLPEWYPDDFFADKEYFDEIAYEVKYTREMYEGYGDEVTTDDAPRFREILDIIQVKDSA